MTKLVLTVVIFVVVAFMALLTSFWAGQAYKQNKIDAYTPTPTATYTPTPVPTATPSPTPVPTATATPVPSVSNFSMTERDIVNKLIDIEAMAREGVLIFSQGRYLAQRPHIVQACEVIRHTNYEVDRERLEDIVSILDTEQPPTTFGIDIYPTLYASLSFMRHLNPQEFNQLLQKRELNIQIVDLGLHDDIIQYCEFLLFEEVN